jgi:hypothetical protein
MPKHSTNLNSFFKANLMHKTPHGFLHLVMGSHSDVSSFRMAESGPTAKSNPIHLSTLPEMYFVKHGLFAKSISGFGPWEKIINTTQKRSPLSIKGKALEKSLSDPFAIVR